MTKKCPVLGCSSVKTKGSELHFFRFPKMSKKIGDVGKLWAEFTRRKNYKATSDRFCQLHFADECFKKGPKGQFMVKKGSVPTIYYRDGKKIVVPYNADYQKYYGPEAERLYEDAENSAFNHGKELLNLRYKKLCDLKNLCRFCFTNSKDTKCIDMSALTSYSVDPEDMLKALSCSSPYTSALSEIICETCFLKVIEIHNFRKKCSEQQKAALAEMDELDRKIQKVQSVRRSEQAGVVPWFKVKFGEEPEDFQNSMLFNSSMVTVEIQTVPPPEIKESKTNVISSATKKGADKRKSSPRKKSTVMDSNDFLEVMVKQEMPDEFSGDDSQDMDDHFMDNSFMDQDDDDFNKPDIPQLPAIQKKELTDSEDELLSDVKAADNSKELVKKPKPVYKRPRRIKENYSDRYYECFFCREKILGRDTFLEHEKVCTVKGRQCDAPGCAKIANSVKSHAMHMFRFHGMPKISAHFCPGCKTYYQMNAFQFQDHSKNCEHNKKVADQPVKCEICRKFLDNLEAYTAHKLFHATDKLVMSVDENGVKTYQKPKKKEIKRICDLCGKTYGGSLGRHKQNVHLVDFTGDMYICDLCPVKKPTRRLLYDHMKSVHIINWHRCPTCGKDFKSRRLLARHTLYMHERHRLNIRCQICPHKPGFSATIYLEQHMRKNHGEQTTSQLNRVRCDYGFCDASFSNVKTLEQHKIKAHGYYSMAQYQ